MRFHIPIRCPSLSNTRMHWRAQVRLKKQQRGAVMYCMCGRDLPPMPVVVTLTRTGPRKLDDDNLQAALKYVRDQIACVVGVDDGSTLYTWKYAQRVGHRVKYGVDVEIDARVEVAEKS